MTLIARSPGRQIAKSRLWLYRLAALLLAPLLLLALLAIVEIGLRLLGIGMPTAWVVRHPRDPVWIANHAYTWPWFGPSLGRAPLPFRLADAKRPQTLRVFILGESAAVGVPDPAFGFGRVLEVMLRHGLPDAELEVINTAVTAVNSHVLRDIARQCARHQPDLLVVYMGNNEIIGPFGPGAGFTGFTPSRSLIQAVTMARSTYLGQWLRAMSGATTGPRPQRWQQLGMFKDQFIAADDRRMAAVYDHFRANLVDICRAGRDAGAVVALCTVAVNLRDCPPFGSLHRPELDAPSLERWRTAFDLGVQLEQAGDHGAAFEAFAEAAALDDGHAELRYRLGRCALALGRPSEADAHFRAACDLDALRIRADSRLNAIIRDVAGEQGAALIDIDRAMAEGYAIPGDDLFYEHVHLRFEGNHLLAARVRDVIAPLLAQRINNIAAASEASSLPVAACAEALGLTDWHRHQMETAISSMMDRPPFTMQMDHSRRSAERHARLARDGPAFSAPAALAAAHSVAAAALQRRPDDLLLKASVADLSARLGDHAAAIPLYEQLIDAVPNAAPWHATLGGLQFSMGRHERALASLTMAVQLDPGEPSSRFAIGNVLEEQQRITEALDQYRDIIRRFPDWPDALRRSAMLLATNPNPAHRQGPEALRYALRLRDAVGEQDLDALIVLAAAQAESGDFPAAVAAIQHALEIMRHTRQWQHAPQLERHLALYLAGQPLRGPSIR